METRRFRWYIRNSISWITKKKNQSKRYRYDFVPFPDSGSRSNAVWGNKKKKRKEKRRTLQENTRMDIAKNDRRRHGNAPFFSCSLENGIRSTPNGTTPQRAAFISQFSNWPPGTKKNQTKKTNKKNKQTNKRKTTIESDAPKWMERNGTKWNGMNEMKRSSNDDPAETNANGKPCNALQTLG